MTIKKKIVSAFGAWAIGMVSTACALPVLDTKDAAVRIDVSGKAMNISSTATNNIIHWVDFSIAGGEKVAFDRHNYLNYVTGRAASEINGMLTGGGNIFIINPNGILIGDGAEVNVGNLYLSTQGLSDAQLAAFRAHGTSPLRTAANAVGDVVNLGHLVAKTVVVEGNVIEFKNAADVEASTINAYAKTETRIGCDGETLPEGWSFFRAGTEGQVAPVKYKLIHDEVDLQKIKVHDVNCRYMLAGNIEVKNDFKAIGTNSVSNNKFLGHFDGLGYGITFTKNIEANGMTVGLFGAIGEGSVVENFSVKTAGLEIPSVPVGDTGRIGGIVGYNFKGTIRNVCHDGSISVSNSSDDNILKSSKYYVGGIAGYNEGGTIENVCNMGSISVSEVGSSHVGGIVGYNYFGKVNVACNVCNKPNDIRIQSNMFGGGIAGGNRGGIIENVYNLVPVSGVWAGGIVGKYYDDVATISNGYHTLGDISGSTTAGGIVGGFEKSGTANKVKVKHVFSANANVAGPTVTEVTEMAKEGDNWWQRLETFEKDGWSISATGGADTTWRICDGYSMPLLAAFLKPKYNSSIVKYDGTRPTGTYQSTPSVSTRLEGFKQGYDYIFDLTWVVPENEAIVAYSFDKEYEDTIVALQHLNAEKQGAKWTAAESEKEKLVVVGSGVRLPDAMSAEDLEAILSGTEEQENA